MSMSPGLMHAAPRADWFVRHRLKLRHLRILVALEDTQNIGRAARVLNTSQPAVSKSIKEIERAAGMPLFERRSHGTFPTEGGRALIRYAREVFGALERAGQELESIASGLTGTLAVGCNFSAAADLVPKALVLLKRANPLLAVTVREASLGTLLPDLRARHLDVVVARWPRGRQIGDLQEHALFEQPMGVVCAPGHPLARAKRVSWSALAGFPWILPPQGSAVRDDLEELFRVRRIKPLQTGIECSSFFANAILLKELRALAIAPLAVARHLQAEHLLAILPVRLPRVFGPNSAITVRGAAHAPATESFIASLSRAARGRASLDSSERSNPGT